MAEKKVRDKEDLAQKALFIAQQQGIDSIEIFVQSSDILQFAAGSAVRIAGRRFYEQGIAIRIIKNNRLGFVCGTTDEDLKKLIKSASLQVHAQIPEAGSYGKSFPPGKEIRQESPNLSDIISIGREELETITNEMMRSTELDPLARTVESSATRHIEERLVANSEGLIRESNDAWIVVGNQAIVRRATGEKGFGFNSILTRDVESFDPLSVGSRAYASAMILSNALRASNREQDRLRRSRRILWHPNALAQLLAHILVPTIARISQVLPETQQNSNNDKFSFPSMFDVLDDPTKQDLIPNYAFDDEGVSTRKKTLISNGKLVSRLSDYSHSVQDSGGNSYRVQYFSERFRSFRYTPVLSPVNLLLDCTEDIHPTNLVDLCSGATIMVQRVIGAHVASPTTGDFSVDVAEGYLARDHQIRFPIRKMSITGNIYHLLKAVRAVGITETVHPLPSPFAISCPFVLTEKSGSIIFS
ncbi:MAG: metallopeptidase TldD-related protein [Candidatus Hodarchaeota archaeon]